MKSLDVVGIGNPTLDILFTPEGVKRLFGGIVVNTIVGVARLDMGTGLIGYIGKEEYSGRIRQELLGYGIELDHLRETDYTHQVRMNASPTRSTIRSSAFYYPVTQLTDEDVKYLASSKSAYARVDSRVFKTCADAMSDSGKIMFASLSGVKSTERKIRDTKSSKIHVVFGTKREIERFGDAINEAEATGTIIVVTRGHLGCEIHYKGGRQTYPSFKVNTIDPTGAGDAFATGFVYGFMNGWDMNTTAYFANACGVLATTQYGARSRVVTKEDAFSLMRNIGMKTPE